MAHALDSQSASSLYPKVWAVVPAQQDRPDPYLLRTLQLCFNTEADKSFYRQNLPKQREFTEMVFEKINELPGQHAFKVTLSSGAEIDLVDVVNALANLPGKPLTLFSQKQVFHEISQCATELLEQGRQILHEQVDQLANRKQIAAYLFDERVSVMMEVAAVGQKADDAWDHVEKIERMEDAKRDG